MQNLNRYVPIVSIASEITHLFCCGLPMVFSLLSLLTSLGLMASMPASLVFVHEIMHDFEVPVIIISAVLIALGWTLHLISQKMNCRTEGQCIHEPCAPKKKKSSKILIVATLLFIFNLAGYLVFHF